MGRPSKFTPEAAHTAATLAKLGYTDERMAAAIGISRSTLHEWRTANPEFDDTLKGAKASADAKVMESLFQRAVGFTGPDGIYHPPHATSCIFWLKNRMGGEWRDTARHEVTGPDGQPLQGPPLIELAPAQDSALQALIQAAQDRVRLPHLSKP
jgi:DNA-binding XRE family transcriptional regulator